MSINFSQGNDSTTISRGPRVVTVYDTDNGCPSSSRSNPLITVTVTTNSPANFWMSAGMIRYANGDIRSSIYCVGPAGSNFASKTQISRRLSWTSVSAWDDVVFDRCFFGNTAGTYTFTMEADSPGLWGCTEDWGHMSVLVMEL